MATRVLVVDDSPTIRTVVSRILARAGYEPDVAYDGQDAYELLASGKVRTDLVLVDFVMPRMNGYQLCRALRENRDLAATPVVLMSAKADRIRDQFVNQTGAVDAISKPFDAAALALVIQNALRKANALRGSSPRLPEFDDVTAGTPKAPSVDFETPAPKAIHDDRSLLSGDLGVVPIGAILQLLQAENQTGVLVCVSGEAEVRATFRGGSIDLVQSTGAGDEFRLGRFFVEEGILTPEEIDRFSLLGGNPPPDTQPLLAPLDHEEVYETATRPGLDITMMLAPMTRPLPKPLGMLLLEAGKIDAAQLKSALTRQSSELLYEVLRWQEGRFELRREPPSELAESARLGLPVASVVMEGFRRVDEWRALERTLGSFDFVLARDEDAVRALDKSTLLPRERTVLDAVNGERTVRAIIAASHVSSFDACRILAQFIEARLIRPRAT